MSRVTGTFHELSIGRERVATFIPATLRTEEKAFVLDARASELLERAAQNLGRLDAVLETVPSLDWLVEGLMRREAVASAQLAGSGATLDDLLASEAGIRVGPEAASEARNILAAMEHGREELGRGSAGLTISVRLLNRAHRRLMQGSAQARAPGHLRTIPIWIGGTIPTNAAYVPPPPFEVGPLLEQLDDFVRRGMAPALVRIAVFFAQFANIRPYLDGNGRLDRLLVGFLLEGWELIRAPVLSLSAFLARHRDDHQRLLAAIRTDGDWESWLGFFFEGVATAAAEGLESARSLLELVSRDRDRVLESPNASVAGLRLLAKLPRHPLLSVPMITKLLDTTPPTAAKAVGLLESLGILAEVSGRKRDRTFSYAAYLSLLGGKTP
jgi:Fic family protein